MISVPIRTMAGDEAGSYDLDPDALAPRISKQLLHDAVVMYESNRRVGSSRTKSRAEVQGSTAKMYRQKGTGRARAGSRRTPVRRGGGHAFALRPRDWGYRLPKKALKLATRMAVLSKFQDEQVTLLDAFELTECKTRHVASVLKALGLGETSTLLAISASNQVIWRACRNIATLDVSPAAEMNAYRVLHQRQLLLTTAALDQLVGKSSSATADASDSASEN